MLAKLIKEVLLTGQTVRLAPQDADQFHAELARRVGPEVQHHRAWQRGLVIWNGRPVCAKAPIHA